MTKSLEKTDSLTLWIRITDVLFKIVPDEMTEYVTYALPDMYLFDETFT